MLINEEKQSQQTENKKFLVSGFLFGWFSGLFLGFFSFVCVCGVACFLFLFLLNTIQAEVNSEGFVRAMYIPSQLFKQAVDIHEY